MGTDIDIERDPRWYDGLNLVKTCARYRMSIWRCPQFLFVIMGIFILTAILVTYQIARTTEEPEVAALIVLALAGILFAIGNVIVGSFERVALSSLSKSEFVSIISHQLRSPLSAIKWQLNMLLADHAKPEDALSAVARGYAEGIVDQNERMIRSVNDLLEVNRIEDNDLILKPAEFSLSALTKKVIDEHQKFAAMSNARISLLIQQNIPMVRADEDRVKSVLGHLLDNAIRYTLHGGDITINIEAPSVALVVWKVTDQGVGIPQKDQQRIFDKFFRSDNITRYQTAGSGIGLFIARAIIKMSGGDIGFFSSVDKGSVFWFSLPAGLPMTGKTTS